MIIDFDNNPSNSIIYTSSIIMDYLNDKKKSRNLDDIFKYCSKHRMEYSLFFLSIDWLYLIGVIKEINQRNEVILCD